MQLRLGIGIGLLRFGFKQDKIKTVLGFPNEIRKEENDKIVCFGSIIKKNYD